MTKVASNTEEASAAVTSVQSVSAEKGKQVTMEKSNISSMKTGKSVNNAWLPDIGELVECVQMQSEKFPQIAEQMALHDSQISYQGELE
ncbi:hypothetical protein VL806_07870 [Listeria seeligeri]|uniref:hypothetical protein n=1 Tax=Listeria seeligeri TaxID=1640 RepID=UPI0018B0869D|nr:hypothetical protein [Listeria seeligeri]QPJ26872.1 hypothetical protein IMX23_01560 [Listeria seeligeri]